MVNFLMIALRWLISGAQVKFVLITVFTSLFAMITYYIIPAITGYVNPTAINNLLSQLPSGFWWLLNISQFNVGFPLIVGAYFTRFTIRRLPVIG